MFKLQNLTQGKCDTCENNANQKVIAADAFNTSSINLCDKCIANLSTYVTNLEIPKAI